MASNSPARHSLETFYDLDGQLPTEIEARVSPHKQHSGIIFTHHEEQAIAKIFKDPRITLEQREKISSAILKGNFEFVPENSPEKHHTKPRLIPKDVERLRIADLTVHRHKLPKPSFLQVITQAAPIPYVSGKEARAQKIRVQLQMGAHPTRTPEVPQRQPPPGTSHMQRGTPKGFHDSDITEEQSPSAVFFQDSPTKSSLKEMQNQLVAEHTR